MGNLVGYGQHNRLRWAAYSPSAGEIHYGPPNNAPKEENLADGFGAPFSPFYVADEIDIQHCISISDWWRKLLAKDLSESVVPIAKGPIKRLHRLISETGPNVYPSGFFDCTVEVLKLFISDQGTHSLFVTDYTPSPGSGSSSKSWPASLNEYVMQFELWDEAARVAEVIMKPGEYYKINNARMKINNSGYMEGKVKEGKITQLEEDDAESDTHLKALLRRKQEWNSKNNTDVDLFQLIQDAEMGKFFDCIVEVHCPFLFLTSFLTSMKLLHIELKPYQMPRLYLTDYSGNSSVAATCGDEFWARGLEGRIIKIMLDEEQKHIAESATIGTVLSVRKLRLKNNAVENGICGILGGGEKLIVPMNLNRIDNVRLQDLIRYV
ncbi:hypothetical protein CVT25_012607 [Psilocybe cyanescens]|uniref:Protection of telomeres protein 1 ssDNA-binding domain-containing protein n=1 Tax=Psilocybe cyanescens TaxID=93625 RepID=A0A409X7X5_PSICY|nr:hypothetical protein CVT25_012607 [Psilocybe cyanescens]